MFVYFLLIICMVNTNAYSVQPRFTIAAFNFNVGPYRGQFYLGSDYNFNNYNMPPAQNLNSLRAALHIPITTQHQIQMITRDFLEAFGLYEPFRKQVKSVVLNNPVYYGDKSGMVNYLKNEYGATNVTETTSRPAEGFKWNGISDIKGQSYGNGDTKQEWGKVIDDANKKTTKS